MGKYLLLEIETAVVTVFGSRPVASFSWLHYSFRYSKNYDIGTSRLWWSSVQS